MAQLNLPGLLNTSAAKQLWYCAACETVAPEYHFRDHICPTCQSGDVFEDEIYEGSYCGQVLANELFRDGENLLGEPCLQCPPTKTCTLVKKVPREATIVLGC